MAQHRSNANGNGGGGRFPRLRNAARAALFLTPGGRDILSNPAFGFFLSQLSAGQYRERLAEFMGEVAASTSASEEVLEETVGVGPNANIRILDDLNLPASQLAELERRIAAGEPLGELERFTERVLPAVAQAQKDAREGTALGDEFFDPEKTEARFVETLAPTVEGLTALPQQVAAGNQAVQDFQSQEIADFAVQSAGLNEGNAALLQTARQLVSSLGVQERADINRSFNELDIFRQQEASSRGVGGGTVAASIQTGVARERTDAQGRLNERLINQQLGVEADFGLSAQLAAERLIAADVNLGGAQAQALQFGNQLYAGTALNALGSLGNIAAGQFDAYNFAASNLLDNRLAFGQFRVNTKLQGAQQALQFRGQQLLIAPSPNVGPVIYPEFQPSEV